MMAALMIGSLALAVSPAPVERDATLEAHLRAAVPGPAAYRSGRILASDYPDAALRARAEGGVIIRLVIGTDGRIQSCDIAQTSSHAALDQTTCRLATLRFVFLPAIGEDGRPTTETRLQRVIWSLPEGPPMREPELDRHLRAARPGPARMWAGSISVDDYPAAALRDGAQGTVTTRFLITEQGRVGHCAITSSSGNADLDNASCVVLINRFRFLPAIGEDGRPIQETRSQRFVWRLPEPAPAAEPAPPGH